MEGRGVDVTLAPVGYVQVRAHSGDVPVTGMTVTAYHGGATQCCVVRGRPTTGPGGSTALQLPEGGYRLRFEPPPSSTYRSLWWKNAADFSGAADVAVGLIQPTTIELDFATAR